MGWEERNGNHYYYQKERQGDTVVSTYIGSGEFARLVAQMDRGRRAERERKRLRFNALKEDLLRQRDRVRHVQQAIRDLERAVLLLNDYHTHKGQWRKHRGH